MRERAAIRLPLRELALITTLVGIGLVALAGARGTRGLLGFGLFAFGIVALDAVWRGFIGFRHLALFLGIAAAGLGLWTALATGLLVLLDMNVPAHMRTLLTIAAACAAGSAATALLAVRFPGWIGQGMLRSFGASARKRKPGPSRPGEAPRGRPLDAGQPLRPAGPVQGG